jgi:hypothetical protein
MADRSSVFESVQLAPEVTIGVVVPATRKLNSLAISIRPQVETDPFRSMGQRADTLIVPGKDYASAKVTGKPTFSELQYLLAGIGTTAVTAASTPLVAPATAPTATESATGGTLAAATYTYEATYMVGGQETLPGTASAGAVCAGATSSVALTAIPTAAAGLGVTSRRLYRASAGVYGLVAEIGDNTTTTWTDTGAVAPGALPPVANGTGGYAWTGELGNSTPDTLKSFTTEAGNSVRAGRCAGLSWTDFGFTVDRSKFDLTGAAVAQSYEDGVAMTAAPTSLPLVPILPKQVDVFCDTSPTAFGQTPLTRAFSLMVSLATLLGPVWPLSTTFASWAGLVELAPKLTASLKAEMDVQGGTILAALKAGQTLYIRVKAAGGAIPGIAGASYGFCFDFACVPNQGGDLADDGGVTIVDFPLSIVYDSAWGHSVRWALINGQAAL